MHLTCTHHTTCHVQYTSVCTSAQAASMLVASLLSRPASIASMVLPQHRAGHPRAEKTTRVPFAPGAGSAARKRARTLIPPQLPSNLAPGASSVSAAASCVFLRAFVLPFIDSERFLSTPRPFSPALTPAWQNSRSTCACKAQRAGCGRTAPRLVTTTPICVGFGERPCRGGARRSRWRPRAACEGGARARDGRRRTEGDASARRLQCGRRACCALREACHSEARLWRSRCLARA